MRGAFLSDEWFAALEERLAATGPLPGDRSVRIGQLVTLPSGDECCWTLELSGGEAPVLERGSVARTDVVLVESYESAERLALGASSATELLAAGEIKVRGDARCLVSAAPLLDALSSRNWNTEAMRPPRDPE